MKLKVPNDEAFFCSAAFEVSAIDIQTDTVQFPVASQVKQLSIFKYLGLQIYQYVISSLSCLRSKFQRKRQHTIKFDLSVIETPQISNTTAGTYLRHRRKLLLRIQPSLFAQQKQSVCTLYFQTIRLLLYIPHRKQRTRSKKKKKESHTVSDHFCSGTKYMTYLS